MRQHLAGIAVAAGLCVAGVASAAPSIEVRDAAVRVVVVPEPRADVQIVVLKSNPRLPLRIWRFSGRTFVSGGLARRIRACGQLDGQPTVFIEGLGVTPLAALPYIAIHTPMDARVFVGGAVWGEAGRSDSLEFSNAGCGDWVIASVRGRLRLSVAGSGNVRAGEAGWAELYSDGSGAISIRAAPRGVSVVDAGSGAINIAEIGGPFTARVAGSGAVRAASGHVTQMQATVAGSGDVTLEGVADALNVSIVGSGDVRVARVTGRVTRSVIGSGKVRIGF